MIRARQVHWFVSLSPVATGVLAGLGVLLPALLVFGLMYTGGVNAVHEEIRGNLKRVATSASLLVDPELHKTFHDRSQESTPEYQRAIAPLAKFIKSDHDFKYVYTFIERDGKLYFVLDPTPAGDSDHDNVDDKSHIMQLYTAEDTQTMHRAAHDHVVAVEDELSADQWGTFLSGYAPIFDSDGNYVATLGVDIAADRYAQRLAEMRRTALVAALVALGIAALVGVAGFLFQKTRNEWMEHQEAAQIALEQFAESLDSANAQLRFANRRFEQLFNHLPVACFTVDKQGTIYEWNQECAKLFGVPAHEVIQHTIYESLASQANHAKFRGLIENVFQDRPAHSFEWSDVGREGEDFTVVVTSFPLYGPEGGVTGGIIACADVTVRKQLQDQFETQMTETRRAYDELNKSRNDLTKTNVALSEANDQLRMLATIDGLTGVLNRRTAFDFLEKSLALHERSGRPLSILMVDIDRFKSLNDAHGHLVGDAVLRSVADGLKEASRAMDTVGRFGGEEFIIVMPDTDDDSAVHAAERIRQKIATSDCRGLHVTVSIGVSTYRPEFGTVEHFVDAADRALYEAKHRGRNKVVHSREITEGAA